MAKKKNKKAQKAVEWASSPPTSKQNPEPAPPAAEVPPPVEEPPVAETAKDELPEAIDVPIESKEKGPDTPKSDAREVQIASPEKESSKKESVQDDASKEQPVEAQPSNEEPSKDESPQDESSKEVSSTDETSKDEFPVDETHKSPPSAEEPLVETPAPAEDTEPRDSAVSAEGTPSEEDRIEPLSTTTEDEKPEQKSSPTEEPQVNLTAEVEEQTTAVNSEKVESTTESDSIAPEATETRIVNAPEVSQAREPEEPKAPEVSEVTEASEVLQAPQVPEILEVSEKQPSAEKVEDIEPKAPAAEPTTIEQVEAKPEHPAPAPAMEDLRAPAPQPENASPNAQAEVTLTVPLPLTDTNTSPTEPPARPPIPPSVSTPQVSAPPSNDEDPALSAPSVATTAWETARSQQSRSTSSDSPKAFAGSKSPPRPAPVKQVIEAPAPAPSPPPTSTARSRSRHAPAFDDDDENDSALVQPRLRGDTVSRDSSRGYPPPVSHNRGPFASRVPSEQYGPPQRPPPSGYHPSYYNSSPAAPPYYHGHSMSQSGGYSPYGPLSHHSPSPYQEHWGQYPPTYPPYGSPPLHRHESSGSREYALTPPNFDDSSAIEDESGEVFTRIAQAIPDLHVLLAKYKETHGQLGVREELLRRAGIEQQERLRIKDEEIVSMKERVASLETKHTNEANRLRFEVANMEEQVKELREQAAQTEKYKREAEETRMALEAVKASWEAKYKDLEATIEALQISTAEEQEKSQREYEEWKKSANTKHDAEKIALAIQFDKKLNEADIAAEAQRKETAAAFLTEKEELRAEHQRQLRERELDHDRVREELEAKLNAVKKEREETLQHERESRELWEADREALVKAHQDDRESLQRGWEEQRELLETQYKQKKEESDKAWIELHAEANRKATEEREKAEKLSKDLAELQKKFEELEAESDKEKEIIKSVAGNLESEKARLEKLMECYGDIAEIKSKGDTYYLVSFSQLQKQILDLAATHFVHLPITPPADVLEKIPPELPSFLGNTSASRQLRSAYIAHIVSAMVTFRVFGPFLFSLGRRYDKADSLFLAMSNHIRDKSTRKEAIWRQQTLLAAFTSSGAKQRINTAAGTVVDEIVSEIRHFADPHEEEGIRIAVRRIVKLAAETWRFARLEREMIAATMPAVHDDKHAFSGPEFWPPHKSEDTPIASLAGTTISDEPPKLLLRLFPVIHREPKHESFHSTKDEKPEKGCIYHHGLALYEDAKCVETRREELRSAGMPPASTASPTAADFPPPVIPPPRNPPPVTPELSEAAPLKSPSQMPPTPPPTTPSEGSRRSPSPSAKSMYSGRSSTRSYRRPIPETQPTLSSDASARLSDPPAERELETLPSTVYVRPVPGPVSYSVTTNKAVEEEPNRNPAPSDAAPESPVPSAKTSMYKPAEETPALSSTKSVASVPPSGSPPPPPSQHSEPSQRSSSVSTKSSKLSAAPYTRPIPVALEDSVSSAEERLAHSDTSIPPSPTPPPPPVEDPTSGAPSQISAPPTRSPPPPPIEQPAPRESAIIPPFLSSSAFSIRTASPPVSPTKNRSPSPLFAVEDEIEALRPHRRQSHSQPSITRRATAPYVTSAEDLQQRRAETTRRTSGYALSKKSSPSLDEGQSAKSQATDRPSMDMSERPSLRRRDSRYSCESRSAAIKGLYPNSPLAGAGAAVAGPGMSRRDSHEKRHELRRKDRMSVAHSGAASSIAGTWDTNSSYATTISGGRDGERDEGEVISVGLYGGGHKGHGHPALERRD